MENDNSFGNLVDVSIIDPIGDICHGSGIKIELFVICINCASALFTERDTRMGTTIACIQLIFGFPFYITDTENSKEKGRIIIKHRILPRLLLDLFSASVYLVLFRNSTLFVCFFGLRIKGTVLYSR